MEALAASAAFWRASSSPLSACPEACSAPSVARARTVQRSRPLRSSSSALSYRFTVHDQSPLGPSMWNVPISVSTASSDIPGSGAMPPNVAKANTSPPLPRISTVLTAFGPGMAPNFEASAAVSMRLLRFSGGSPLRCELIVKKTGTHSPGGAPGCFGARRTCQIMFPSAVSGPPASNGPAAFPLP